MVSADIRSTRTFDALVLSGDFGEGSLVQLDGLAAQTVTYTVTKADLTPVSGLSASASRARVLENIAKKVATQINTAGGSLAVASVQGSALVLSPRQSGLDAGWYDINTRVSGKGSVLLARQAASVSTAQVDLVSVNGTFKAGDRVVISGVTTTAGSPRDITYTLTANDLTVNGDGTGGKATAAQVQARVTERIQAIFAEPARIQGLIQQTQSDIESLSMSLALRSSDWLYMALNPGGLEQIRQLLKAANTYKANLQAQLLQLPAYGSAVSVTSPGAGLLVFTANQKAVSFQLSVTVEGATSQPFSLARGVDLVAQRGALQLIDDGQGVNRSPAGSIDQMWRSLDTFAQGRGLIAAAGAPVPGAGSSGIFLGQVGADSTVQWSNITRNATSAQDWVAVAANDGVAAALTDSSVAAQAGRYLIAVATGGQLHVADTQRVMPGSEAAPIYQSNPDWQWRVVGESRNWVSVAISADGRTMAAAAAGTQGGIWASSDFGTSWRLVQGSLSMNWRSVALNAEGTRLVAVADHSGIYATSLRNASGAMPTRVAVEAQAASAQWVGLPAGFAMSVRDASVGINLPESEGGQVIDFANSGFDLVTGTGTTRRMSLAGSDGEQLTVAAGFTVQLDNYVYLDGSAAFQKKSATVQLADQSAVQVEALTLGASNVQAFAGLGGPYRVVTGSALDVADGVTDGLNTRAKGFSMGEVDLALGLFQATSGQVISGVSLDHASWLALSASAGSVEVVGIPDITLSGSDFRIQVNRSTQWPVAWTAVLVGPDRARE